MESFEVGFEPRVVERERADHVGAAGECHDADAIVGPAVDELFGDLFYSLEAVGLFASDGEVFREHGAGDVDGEHDVESAGAGDFVVGGDAGTREGEDEQREGGEGLEKAESARGSAHGGAESGERSNGGEAQGAGASVRPEQPCGEGDQEEEQECVRIGEVESGVGPFDGQPFAEGVSPEVAERCGGQVHGRTSFPAGSGGGAGGAGGDAGSGEGMEVRLDAQSQRARISRVEAWPSAYLRVSHCFTKSSSWRRASAGSRSRVRGSARNSSEVWRVDSMLSTLSMKRREMAETSMPKSLGERDSSRAARS